MKVIGAIIIIASTTLMGLSNSNRIKCNVELCGSIIDFCNLILYELDYTATPMKEIINKSNLSFINEGCLHEKAAINTLLTKEENKSLSDFLYRLGKSDIETQKMIVKNYCDFMINTKRKYENIQKSKFKINISLGLCFGVVLVLVII